MVPYAMNSGSCTHTPGRRSPRSATDVGRRSSRGFGDHPARVHKPTRCEEGAPGAAGATIAQHLLRHGDHARRIEREQPAPPLFPPGASGGGDAGALADQVMFRIPLP